MDAPEQRTRTFSVLECFVVLAILASIAVVAIPRWSSEQIVENERSAVQFLAQIARAQVDFRQQHGTFGFFEELLGEPRRQELRALRPTLVAQDPVDGILYRQGYLFSVYLPSRDGEGALLPEAVSPDRAKDYWVAYAWPNAYGASGRRVFVVLPSGQIYSHENTHRPLSGPDTRPFATLAWARMEGPDVPFLPPGETVKKLIWDPE